MEKFTIIRLDCEFIPSPRIIFNDKNINRTDNDLLSLIISLALKYNYCFANNDYLADSIGASTRTISDSLSKLKRLKYIIIKNEKGKRKIYLNGEKIPLKIVDDIANECISGVAESCYHNINNQYKNKYRNNKNFKGNLPEWVNHPEKCVSEIASKEEQEEMRKMLAEIYE